MSDRYISLDGLGKVVQRKTGIAVDTRRLAARHRHHLDARVGSGPAGARRATARARFVAAS